MIRASHSYHPESSALQPVIINEKFFQFLAELVSQIVDSLNVGPTVSVLLYRDDPVVAVRALFVNLLALDHSDRPAGKCATGKCRLIHEHQHIDGVAVTPSCGGNKAKVIGKRHSRGQYRFQLENVLVRVVGELITASLGSFNDDAQQLLVIAVDGIQA